MDVHVVVCGLAAGFCLVGLLTCVQFRSLAVDGNPGDLASQQRMFIITNEMKLYYSSMLLLRLFQLNVVLLLHFFLIFQEYLYFFAISKCIQSHMKGLFVFGC